jgi:hypothetical protein
MKRLRVVGTSRDSRDLILSNKPKGREGSHVVEIDKRLLGALQKAVYAQRDEKRAANLPPARAAILSKLQPKEIQRHLRAGMAPAQVARLADVSVEYVDQFYTPVLYERDGVIRDAQALYQEKARLGASSLPLGEAVASNLTARHVKTDDDALADAWSATRQDGQPWVVSLVFSFRGRSRTARWRFDPRARSLEPANKLAADIGWSSEARRERQKATEATAGKKPARRKAAKRAKPARKKPVRKKAAPRKKAIRRKPTARKKTTRRTPAKKSARRKAAPRRKGAPRRKPAARKKPARRKPAARKKPARRKPAARKKPARRKTASRKKPVRRQAASRRKPARRRR